MGGTSKKPIYWFIHSFVPQYCFNISHVPGLLSRAREGTKYERSREKGNPRRRHSLFKGPEVRLSHRQPGGDSLAKELENRPRPKDSSQQISLFDVRFGFSSALWASELFTSWIPSLVKGNFPHLERLICPLFRIEVRLKICEHVESPQKYPVDGKSYFLSKVSFIIKKKKIFLLCKRHIT